MKRICRNRLMFVHRKKFGINRLYKHYGIDVGDGEVVHLVDDERYGRNKGEVTRVVKTSHQKFQEDGKGGLSTIHYQSVRTPFTDDQITQEALGFVQIQATQFKPGLPSYLLEDNCEHFARAVITGIKESTQVQQVILVSSAIGVGAYLLFRKSGARYRRSRVRPKRLISRLKVSQRGKPKYLKPKKRGRYRSSN